MPKNRKNVASMLHINVSERNTSEIFSLCAISENWIQIGMETDF